MPPRASASTSSPTSSSVPRLPAPSKKRTTPSSGGASPGSSAKSAPLEMRERRRRDRSVARRQLLDGAGGQAGEILGRPPERGEDRPSRLVRQRDRDLGPRGQRLEQRPLRAGEVLEAVGEDRLAVPGVEVGPQALDGVTAQQAAVPARRGGRARRGSRHRARRARPRPRRATGAPRRARRASARATRRSPHAAAERGVAVELGAAHDAADEERLLQHVRAAGERPWTGSEPAKEVVERADRAAEQRRTPRQQLELDAVDVRPVRHDEHRLAPVPGVERGEIAVEQELDLARVGRARDEAERHPPTLARARDGL